MKAKLTLESGREIEMELTEKQVELVRKETKWPQVGDLYYSLDNDGAILNRLLNGNGIIIERDRQSIGNMFRTKQEAANMVRALRLIEAVRQDRLELNGDWKPDWFDLDNGKYHLTYCHYEDGFHVKDAFGENHADAFGYFKQKSYVWEIIMKYHDELAWYFTEFLPERG